MTLAMCMQAKDASLTSCGATPEQSVLGCPLRWCAPSTNEEDASRLPASGRDGSHCFGVASSDGGKNCVAGARPLKKKQWVDCCSRGQKITSVCRIRTKGDRGQTRRGGADLQQSWLQMDQTDTSSDIGIANCE